MNLVLIDIYNITNNTWTYHVYGTQLLARINRLNSNAQVSVNEPTYYLYDHLGNTRVTYQPTATQSLSELDENGNSISYTGTRNKIIYAGDYFAYGKILREFSEGAVEKYLTTFHERDEETGLDYRGARYYDSEIGRFLSTDPLAGKAPGWSPYRFCFDNPIIYTDPDGRFETRKEARAYKKEHGIEGVIRKDIDGGFNVSNKWTGQEWHKGTEWERENGFTNSEGVVEGAFVVGNKSNYEFGKFIDGLNNSPQNPMNMHSGAAGEADWFWTLFMPAPKVSFGTGVAAKGGIGLADDFLASATKSWGEQGLTVVGRALQKHAGREGSVFQGVKFSHKTANEDALNILNNIMGSKNQIIQQAKGGGQYIFDKTTGRGFGVSREGLFNGFRELGK